MKINIKSTAYSDNSIKDFSSEVSSVETYIEQVEDFLHKNKSVLEFEIFLFDKKISAFENNWQKKLQEIYSEKLVKKDKFREFGKLGGRPKKDKRKARIISIRINEDDYEKLIEDFSKSKVASIGDFYRLRLLNENIQETRNTVEINKKLIEIHNNFSRLSNFMKKTIFTDYERSQFLRKLEEIIYQVKSSVKW